LKGKVGSDGDMDLEKNNREELEREEKERRHLARNKRRKEVIMKRKVKLI